jgi:hypothetical protein
MADGICLLIRCGAVPLIRRLYFGTATMINHRLALRSFFHEQALVG